MNFLSNFFFSPNFHQRFSFDPENLERKNLAFRQRDEHDKRIINVFLTNSGEELMLKFSDRIEFLGKNIFDDIPMDKREGVKEALELLLWHLARRDVK